jgi:hypothetical protein
VSIPAPGAMPWESPKRQVITREESWEEQGWGDVWSCRMSCRAGAAGAARCGAIDIHSKRLWWSLASPQGEASIGRWMALGQITVIHLVVGVAR